MQNFREKYAYKISLYLLVFYSIWISLALIEMALFLSKSIVGNDLNRLLGFMLFMLEFAPILLLLSAVLRLFSLDSLKNWIDIGLFLIVTFITGYLLLSGFVGSFSFVLPFVPLFFTIKSLFELKRRENYD